jgi:hypothetical protein
MGQGTSCARSSFLIAIPSRLKEISLMGYISKHRPPVYMYKLSNSSIDLD